MKYIILLVIFLFSISSAATISGTIRDKKTGEPLPYANIVIAETDIGTASDINGYYIIPLVEPGSYILKVMMIGYAVSDNNILVENNHIRLDIELTPQLIDVDEVKVSAERMRFERKVDISRVNITNRDIRRAPAFVEADLFRTLQLLPSVSSSNDFNAALIVRGGSPDENLILLDGTEIYNPYHIGGVFSTFNADMISDSEFLAGGFPANYGGRLSSVLNITAREGDSKNGRLSENNPIKKYWDFSKGSGNISLLSSKFLAEGALYNGSWMISGRRTYFDKLVSLYYDFKDDKEPGNYYFWDTHIKLKTSINQNNQLIYSQFSGKDNLFMSIGGEDFPGIDFAWDWGNSTKNISWRYIPNSNYLITTRLSKTKYNFNVDFEMDFNPDSVSSDTSDVIALNEESSDLSFFLDNLVEDIDLNQSIKYILSDNVSFESGWQIKTLKLDYREIFAEQEVTNINSKPQIISTFVNVTLNPIPIIYYNIGFRLSKFNRYDDLILNPKMGIKYNPISDLALKASYGRYSQFLYTINQEEELLRIVDFWQPIPEDKKPQEADHFIIGAEYWISTGNTISLETYYKSYSSIYDLNPRPDYTDIQNTFALSGTAKAYGIEFLYRMNRKKLNGWLSYAYSNINRTVDLNSDDIIWDEKEIYPAKYDKPHSFNALLSYQINKKYSLGLSTTFGSGQTYTPIIGKVHQTGVQSLCNLENPYCNFGNIYGNRNGSRYPNYFRTDISLSTKSNLFGLDSEWKFQIINLTNNYNVLLYLWDHNASPSKVQAYSMFPRIFTFGWEFKI